MTTAATPPALAIADLLEYLGDGGLQFDGQPLPDAAAAELIRLQAELECLRKELEARKPLPPVEAIKLGMEAQQACRPHGTGTTNWAAAMTRFYERAHGITGGSS